MQKQFALLAAILLAIAIPASAAPAPLADRIPADAILYVGWAGADALSAKYDQSHLRAIVDASDIPEAFNKFLPEVLKHFGVGETKEAVEVFEHIVAIGKPMWKHPTALYFGGIDFNAPQPLPKLAILCDAGDDAPGLADQISKLIEEDKKTDSGPYPIVKTYGSIVAYGFGSPAQFDADFAVARVNSLGSAPKFNAALQQVQQDPAFIEFMDPQSLIKLIDQAVQKNTDAKTMQRWVKARDSLGLSGLHELIATMGFDRRDWATEGFVATTDGDAGILSLFHGTPLSQDIFNTIPKSADRVMVGKFDLDGFVGHMHDMVAQLDPETAQQIDEGLAQVNNAAGLDVRKDVLATLGDEWAVYSDRATSGPGVLGSVIVNHLKDADAADKGITQFTKQLNTIIAQQMQNPEMKIEFHENVVNGVTIHYLAVPLITPSWAVHDGNLYIGMYPQVVSAAVDRAKNHGPSILERPEYIALMHKLGDHPACSVEFNNLPATAADSYSDLLMFTRLYFGAIDMSGLHPPAMMIPPLGKITPELSPSGSVAWSDATGMHMKSISPFPGSELIANGNKDCKPAPVNAILNR